MDFVAGCPQAYPKKSPIGQITDGACPSNEILMAKSRAFPAITLEGVKRIPVMRPPFRMESMGLDELGGMTFFVVMVLICAPGGVVSPVR